MEKTKIKKTVLLVTLMLIVSMFQAMAAPASVKYMSYTDMMECFEGQTVLPGSYRGDALSSDICVDSISLINDGEQALIIIGGGNGVAKIPVGEDGLISRATLAEKAYNLVDYIVSFELWGSDLTLDRFLANMINEQCTAFVGYGDDFVLFVIGYRTIWFTNDEVYTVNENGEKTIDFMSILPTVWYAAFTYLDDCGCGDPLTCRCEYTYGSEDCTCTVSAE